MHSASDTKPIVSLSMDLDNQWSYMKTHGYSGWDSFPSFVGVLIPYVLDVIEEHILRITFLSSARMLHWGRITTHLHRSRPVGTASGVTHSVMKRPKGFRGTGFRWSRTLLEVLTERGFEFDATLLPTFIGPLARFYYFSTSSFDRKERHPRNALFGTVTDGFRPVGPYKWKLPHHRIILEISVTITPIIRTPFHLSYLLYLSRYLFGLMKMYFRLALQKCRITGIDSSFLLHPLDFLGGDQVPALAFFPGMDLTAAQNRPVIDMVITELKHHFQPVDMYQHAEIAAARNLFSILATIYGAPRNESSK